MDLFAGLGGSEAKNIMDEKKSKIILLDLEIEDFSHTLNNEHEEFEHEILYIFGKGDTVNQFGNRDLWNVQWKNIGKHHA